MSGRMTLGSLFVLAVLIPGLCQAQSGYGNGPSGPPGTWSAPGPVGPACPQPAPSASNTIYEQLPDDLGFLYDDSPFDNFVGNLFRHAYFRGEYLLWSVTAPKDSLLGGLPASGFVPSTVAQPLAENTFIVAANPLTGNPATAIEPSLNGFNLRNLNGYRGTIGVPIGPGTFEVNAWILATRSNSFDGTSLIKQEIPPDLLATPPITTDVPATFIGQPITIDGVAHTMLYTNGYEAQYQTSIWGSEANYIHDAPNAGLGEILTISPLAGFRYLNFRETLAQTGSYQYVTDNTTSPPTTAVANRSIYSQSNNHVYGPQVGFRAEVNIPHVTFGAEPKVMVGLNTYDAGLQTTNVPFDTPSTNTPFNFTKTQTTFSPIVDVKLYSRIQISQYLHAFVAYNLMYTAYIQRPQDNINYNITSTGLGLFNPRFTDATIQGLTVGGELRY